MKFVVIKLGIRDVDVTEINEKMILYGANRIINQSYGISSSTSSY